MFDLRKVVLLLLSIKFADKYTEYIIRDASEKIN